MTYERDLREIEIACREVFGTQIEVAPRALQVLLTSFREVNLLRHEFALTSDFECFRRILVSSPAYADAILRNNDSLVHLIHGQSTESKHCEKPRLGDFKKLLTNIFISRFPFKQGLHPAGDNVRATGVLTEADLFIGCLQAGRLSILPNKTAQTLLHAAGFDAEYPTIKADNYLAKLEEKYKSAIAIDESHAEQQIILYLDANHRIRVQIFGANTLGQIEEKLSKIGTFVFRGGVIQPAPTTKLFSSDSIEELEDLINSKSSLEQQYQNFFERHPEFLKALDYKRIHAQPILYKDDGTRLIPDFFLEQVDGAWHAIADLKRPYAHMVVRRKNRVYFAQWIQDAIAQLQYYREWFESPSNREMFEQTQKLSTRVYRPKMVLIAGRASDFIDDIERIRLLTTQDAHLSLWTYDEVLSRARKYRAFAEGKLLNL